MTLRSSKRLIVVGLVALAASLTVSRLSIWRDPVALWTSAMEDAPRSTRTLNNLGVALVREGQSDEAVQLFERAVANSPDVERPWSRDIARLNLAISYAAAKRYEDALALLAQIQFPPYQAVVRQLERQWQAEWLTGQSFTAQSF